MDDRRARPAAGPDAARARRRHRRHRAAGGGADRAGRHADLLGLRAGDARARAQRRAEELGVRNVRFKQIDAETSIDVEAASLDGVLCRWGYMLMADRRRALRETRRVLKPGARVALAAWAAPGGQPVGVLPNREMTERGLGEQGDPDSPNQFTWAQEGLMAEHVEAAGFTEHHVESLEFRSTTARRQTGGTPSRTSRPASPPRCATRGRRTCRGPRRRRPARRALHAADGTRADPRAHVGRLGGRLVGCRTPCSTTTTLTSRSSTARPSRSSGTAPRATPTR